MNPHHLLREYLRTSRRVRSRPSPEGSKKLEYLRFIGANLCPACGEEVELDSYVVGRDSNGEVAEKYQCPTCDSEFVFPQEPVH
jgi:predicted RNA-binding Zn-ribbon protein involved in translation (DUF1610 family)